MVGEAPFIWHVQFNFLVIESIHGWRVLTLVKSPVKLKLGKNQVSKNSSVFTLIYSDLEPFLAPKKGGL